MTLSSTSTFDQIKAAYADNAAYDEVGSVPMAKAFRTSCRLLIAYMPKRSKAGPASEIDLNPELIKKELDAVTLWLASHDTTTGGSVGGVAFGTGGPTVTTIGAGGR